MNAPTIIDPVANIRSTLERLLGYLDVSGKVETYEEDGRWTLNIVSEDSNLLIGQYGANLAAIQYLLRCLVRRQVVDPPMFTVDVEGYRSKRTEALREIAAKICAHVRSVRTPVILKPMSAFERRVVHTFLAEFPDLTTESIGVEPERRIVVKPKAAISAP